MRITTLVVLSVCVALVPTVVWAVDLESAPNGHRWSWVCNVRDDLGARFPINGVIKKVPKSYLTDGFKLDQVSTKDRHFRWLGWFSKDDKSMPNYLDNVKFDRSAYQMTFENTWGYIPQAIDIHRNIFLSIGKQGNTGRGKFHLVRNKRIWGATKRENRGVSASGPCVFQDMS